MAYKKKWVLFEKKKIKLWNQQNFMENKTEIMQNTVKCSKVSASLGFCDRRCILHRLSMEIEIDVLHTYYRANISKITIKTVTKCSAIKWFCVWKRLYFFYSLYRDMILKSFACLPYNMAHHNWQHSWTFLFFKVEYTIISMFKLVRKITKSHY